MNAQFFFFLKKCMYPMLKELRVKGCDLCNEISNSKVEISEKIIYKGIFQFCPGPLSPTPTGEKEVLRQEVGTEAIRGLRGSIQPTITSCGPLPSVKEKDWTCLAHVEHTKSTGFITEAGGAVGVCVV